MHFEGVHSSITSTKYIIIAYATLPVQCAEELKVNMAIKKPCLAPNKAKSRQIFEGHWQFVLYGVSSFW